VQVDWLTVSAQWVNLFILALLLRRFLYGPIIRAMDRRQQAIEARLLEARQKSEHAEQQAAQYRNKARELDEHRAGLLAEAREEAAREKANLNAQARAEVRAMEQRWLMELEREKDTFQMQLRRELGRLVLASARKALKDLCSIDLEQALIANFLERLERLSGPEKRRLSESGHGQVMLASSAGLDDDQRHQILEALRDALGPDLSVRFEPLSDSDYGLVLMTPAYTLEWRLERYFQDLGQVLEAAMAEAGQTGGFSHVE